MPKRSIPEVNAGSMADIAFLLLIFFLVTTTIEQDNGIVRKLPAKQEDIPDPPKLKQKNIFTVVVDKSGQMLVEDQLMDIKDLRKSAVAFIDNGGGVSAEGNKCDYCKGEKDPASSDHPSKAIIALRNDRQTKYEVYVAIQNELGAAYTELRNREALSLYNESYESMNSKLKDANFKGNKDKIKDRIKVLKDMYPQFISEAEPKK